MPLQRQLFAGELGLPVAPTDQAPLRLCDIKDNDISEEECYRLLPEFKYPPVIANAYELYMYVSKDWKLRCTYLEGSKMVLLRDNDPHRTTAGHVAMAAFVLRWVAGLEAWMRLFFLRDVFSHPTGTGSIPRQYSSDREFLVDRFGELWDTIFGALREFLVDIHYIDSRGDSDVMLPFCSDKALNYQVYVAPTNKVLTVLNHYHHRTEDREPWMGLTWWDHRRVVLSTPPTMRQGVQWLYQDREEMKELGRRYPDASVLIPGRGPYMPPAIQFR